MTKFASKASRDEIHNEMSWQDRPVATTLYGMLENTAAKHGRRNAVTFQLLATPGARAETLTWSDLKGRVTQAANMFRGLGVGEKDVIAFLLPNCTETTITVLGAQVAGIVSPINPLLNAEQIGSILRETGAKVLVTLKSFPKTEVAQLAAEAVSLAPNVQTVVEVDMLRYLSPPKSWIVPFIRPKTSVSHRARVIDFNRTLKAQNTTLDFEDVQADRISAFFHTGGTTGMPKVAQHRYSGFIYNGWLSHRLLFDENDTLICPLPLFHVFAAVVVMSAVVASGGHAVFPTPQGYRGAGVFDNFWKLIERWKVTFVITVPTAISALMQRPVDADVSSLKTAFSGSAPLPVELFHRFEKATGVTVVEGYGLTEATCLVSCNPPEGDKKIGSVGVPLPYSDVRILECEADGTVISEKATDEIGEICVSNPGVFVGHTYSEAAKNVGLYADKTFLRTGDLGRIDADGYLWITGRAKDLIIRGGHNIDPAEIEDALSSHPDVAIVGAIGQPDAFAGELPCAYVELVDGASVSVEDLMNHARAHIHERAACPKYLEVLDELPKTAVGKVFKPDLRRMAIARVFDAALAKKGLDAKVGEVLEDKKLGLVAQITGKNQVDQAGVAAVLDEFAVKWAWAERDTKD